MKSTSFMPMKQIGNALMANRMEVLEAALDTLPEGIALLSGEGQVIFWNRAAAEISGQAGADLLARRIPPALEPLLLAGVETGRGSLIHLEHKLGHDVTAIVRNLLLRDEMGGRIGMAIVFHPAECLDALPHGECGEGSRIERSLTEFEDRLRAVFTDFEQGGESFGVLRITVDQAHELRRTHGLGACEAMLEKVERVLANGLRPAEQMGRWGDDEFLVLSHERTPEMLAAHAQVLAGLARTTDFRWWGDRVSLTTSVGAAQAERDELLADLLGRAKAAMFTSFHAGGNQITSAPGRHSCSPS